MNHDDQDKDLKKNGKEKCKNSNLRNMYYNNKKCKCLNLKQIGYISFVYGDNW
jgi:hypothetical protein